MIPKLILMETFAYAFDSSLVSVDNVYWKILIAKKLAYLILAGISSRSKYFE